MRCRNSTTLWKTFRLGRIRCPKKNCLVLQQGLYSVLRFAVITHGKSAQKSKHTACLVRQDKKEPQRKVFTSRRRKKLNSHTLNIIMSTQTGGTTSPGVLNGVTQQDAGLTLPRFRFWSHSLWRTVPTAVGQNAMAGTTASTAANSTALGFGANAASLQATAVGVLSSAAQDGTAVGQAAAAEGKYSTAIGYLSKAGVTIVDINATAVAHAATASFRATAIGGDRFCGHRCCRCWSASQRVFSPSMPW